MLVQVTRTERVYGGPEEGGWWYDWTDVQFTKRTTKRLAKKLMKRLSIMERVKDDRTESDDD